MLLKAKIVTNSMLGKVGMELNDEWKKLHKFVQTWLFVLIGVSGDLYNELSSDGLLTDFQVPGNFLKYLHMMAVIGIAVKLFKKTQAEVEQEEEQAQAAKTPAAVVADAAPADQQLH